MPSARSDNQGIIADTVNADVMAVGRRARATKSVEATGSAALRREADALSAAIDTLALSTQHREALQENVTELRKATGAKPDADKAANHLRAICDKLQMVGVVVRDVAALAEPARQIAEMLHIPLQMLGLG